MNSLLKEGKELVHHAEKPEHFIGNLINCGVYIFSKSSKEAFLQARQMRTQVSLNFWLNPMKFLKKIEELEKSKKNLYLTGSSKDLNKDYLSIEKDLLMVYAGKRQIFIYQLTPSDFWRKITTSQ